MVPQETSTPNEFHRDMLLMFANAIMYHDEDSEMAQMAEVAYSWAVEIVFFFGLV
jgi:hypothetical protein